MAKKKLFEDIKSNPARFYRMPADVLRDRRFADEEKLEILRAWRGMGDIQEIDGLITDLERRFSANGHAAE
ncbi:MAG TPA: hypothetical protein VHV26_04935 [Rhizomicrobium sp.]|jgi:hypothetical protein|nr:hypothetical protein [Rhizomicrobium sp.]